MVGDKWIKDLSENSNLTRNKVVLALRVLPQVARSIAAASVTASRTAGD